MKKAGTFESPQHERAWLLKVTANCAKDMWRSAWFRKTVPLNEEIVFVEKEENDLSGQLKKLPENHRIALHLFYYEDMPVARIADVMGQKETTVRTWLTRARAKLGKQIREDEQC